MKHSNTTVSSGKLQFAELIKAHFYTPFGVPCEHPLPLPLGEVAERSEDGEGKQKRTASGRFFSLSINPLYAASSSFTQGELEGAKPASNQIKCRAKPCLARRAWSEATIFVPQGGTKITTLFQAVEKSRRLFRQPERDGALAPSLCPCLKDVTTGSCPPRRRDRWGGTCRHPPGGAAPGSTRCP